MARKRRAWFIFGGIDLVLLGLATVLLVAGAMLVRHHPVWWGYYLLALDIRVWPPWKCIGLAVIVAESLVIIRRWPNKKRQTPIAQGYEKEH